MSTEQAPTTTAVEHATAILRAHQWVARASAEAGAVRVWPEPSTVALRPEPGPLLREYLGYWADVYDWVYERGEARHADDLDLSGWRASDTGQPFATTHMTEWVERTVEIVLRTRPRVVLELGCGSGLLLHRLRRQVAAYVGTEVSLTAVARLAAAGLPGVAVIEAAAHEAGSAAVREALAGLAGAGARPDCVLLNSVTQHFPNAEYLATTVLEALALVAEGGTVVVGDARHLGLLDRYCRWLETASAPDTPPAQLAARAAARAAREEELLVDPRLLARIAAASGREVSMLLYAKTMRDNTELTRYRYDVVLRVEPPAPDPGLNRLHWHALPREDRLGALRALAEAGGPLYVDAIPNALLVTDDGAAVSGYELWRGLRGLDAAVCLDLADPTRLVVGVPAEAAAMPVGSVPVPEGAALAHEPLALFVRRRLPEVLRDHLRRVDPALAEVEVRTG